LFRQCDIFELFRQCDIFELFRQCGIFVFHFLSQICSMQKLLLIFNENIMLNTKS
jgi:hypothetical protein